MEGWYSLAVMWLIRKSGLMYLWYFLSWMWPISFWYICGRFQVMCLIKCVEWVIEKLTAIIWHKKMLLRSADAEDGYDESQMVWNWFVILWSLNNIKISELEIDPMHIDWENSIWIFLLMLVLLWDVFGQWVWVTIFFVHFLVSSRLQQ